MLPVTWDSVLICVSLIVVFIASFTALDTAGRVAVSRGWSARFWLLVGGIAMGIGVWAMHFIGMLAMMMPMMMRYDTRLTILSLLVAILASVLAFGQTVGGLHLTRQRLLRGTLILGAGVVVMHYLGMYALLIEPQPEWNALLVALSVLIAFAASGLALWLAFHLRQGDHHLMLMRGLASLVMGIAIAGMHYVGMAAAEFSHSSMMQPHGVSNAGLAVWVTLITLTILGITLLSSMLDAQLRAARLATRLNRANQELRQLAMHDNLTTLPNRVMLEQQLDLAIKQAMLNEHRFAVIYMDLDGFKAVNDTWGHHVGDRLLVAVAERLCSQLSNTMLLVRLGGDEFVLMAECDISAARQLAQKLVKVISSPFELDRYVLHVSLSAGIAIFPLHGRNRQELLFNADAAMYHTKHSGRNGWCLFEPAMSAATQHQLELANDLWEAIEREQMRLFYQPKFCSGGTRLMGFEALLRWQHPQRGLLTPELFLPRAEKTGQIIALGNWVIGEACRQLRIWHSQGHSDWTVSVNLSALQFHQRDLLTILTQTLARNQLPGSALMLEITEAIAMRDPAFSQQRIRELQQAGVSVAIDNFGIGYANLLHLKDLDASELKIDRSFINCLRPGSEDATVVSAMLTLAQSLNLRMVAEGVETEEQQHLLTSLGFDALQGYLLGKPTPADRVEALSFPSLRQPVASLSG
ncbi:MULTISPECIES: putative bifunctional diguanylate cyclase/phosphodiesterase [Pantoea]|jgi:diguanylate cyclase (GGDEF)-like protein|uniref:putative bifunctional diguanylate cyclase/phosphodiesterase n=1 Tax=Pantoea TaxID=53335 RepID=UPI000F07FD7F|nr:MULTISPECIES: bifunctional diguanylate cyclase/phosphodiesterase [Pantoea]KAF6681606.1 EAL domain-containing protein [Pantoea sp. EKM20T]MBD8118546.1 EAL domain-containing protein [Pantoea agglomerans]MBT8497108.1 membrane protein [Pantoea agglomerans]QAV45858.1 bifunctional diguanylate cyclase/phosphodiesterase [Pantoea agglomerans]QAV50699.1 bifunctional diguanylate cyclase/phosphodiesterase [Pantoea agglomerans]